jgi:transposase
MEIILPCCAGLDVHKKTVVACARRLGPDGQVVSQVRTFGTMTTDLLALGDWLAAQGVTRVAMESTGVYWKPVWHLLVGRFDLVLVNAAHLKHVPGRKTDVLDAEWIAELLQYGLLKASFVPPAEIQALRDLTRQRTRLVQQRATVANRIQKVLEDANLKLGSVASDVLGKSGRAILAAIVAGQSDPAQLADLARGSLRGKRAQLRQALHGRVTDHHRFLLGMLLDQLRQAEEMIARYTARIEEVMAPFEPAVQRMMTIPGVGRAAAEVILAEIGPDMGRFPTAGHLSVWAGMCPGNNQTGGKRRPARTTKGSRWLRSVLVQVAWAASKAKGTPFPAAYRRWSRRLGAKRALIALGHKLLVIVYKVLKERTVYTERPSPVVPPTPGQAA